MSYFWNNRYGRQSAFPPSGKVVLRQTSRNPAGTPAATGNDTLRRSPQPCQFGEFCRWQTDELVEVPEYPKSWKNPIHPGAHRCRKRGCGATAAAGTVSVPHFPALRLRQWQNLLELPVHANQSYSEVSGSIEVHHLRRPKRGATSVPVNFTGPFAAA